MQIKWIKLKGIRNFNSSHVNFNEKSLVIGSNDVGKTNLLYAVRILMDRTLSEADIEPSETDFHVKLDGTQASQIEITIKLSDVKEDAVLSRLKGFVTDEGETYLRYEASLSDLEYRIFIGHDVDSLEEIDSRFYLKHIHFRYIQSRRDLSNFVRSEKRHLLKLSKEDRDADSVATDKEKEAEIQTGLSGVNNQIGELSYVSDATKTLNEELQKLSHHHSEYAVNLEAKSVNFSTFIDQLSLGASTQNRKVGLGGDGRNNQILMALWKAKSERGQNIESEAVIYCVEEPEAHLHPHQQRKLTKYLIDELSGQVFVSTHSPQITQAFSPDSIVRLYERKGKTVAASKGCSDCIDAAWCEMGYRMSIIPAEAFFADAVLLVEGPSEVLFYHELAVQLDIDLDYYNISILSVDGIQFEVFVGILRALKIPWVMRTDNDVFKVPRSNPVKWNFAGLNRSLRIAGKALYRPYENDNKPDLTEEWVNESKVLNPRGIYVAENDLENDLGATVSDAMKKFVDSEDVEDAISYLQKKKALRMGEFLKEHKECLADLNDDNLAKPLHHAVCLVKKRRDVATEA